MQEIRFPCLDLMCPQLVFRLALRPPGGALDSARPVSPFPRLVFSRVYAAAAPGGIMHAAFIREKRKLGGKSG